MYLRVSRWRPLPGKEEDFRKAGLVVRGVLRSQPGVTMLEGFVSGDDLIAVHGYQDRDAYERIVADPNGPFVNATKEHRLEEFGQWKESWEGDTFSD